MPSALDVTVNTEWIKTMAVGESGTGKSQFAASFPTPGFVFDFGKEILSYRGKDFTYEQYELTAQGWSKYERDFIQVKKDVKEKVYKTVIVDNLSSMTDLCMEKALQLDPKRSATGGPLWQVHYSMVKNLMEGKLRQMLNLDCNLVFIAHLDPITDDNGAVIGVEPSLTGKLSGDVPAYFDEVFYHAIKRGPNGPEWVIQTVPIGRNHGRSRASGRERLLPDILPNDYAEIMAYLTGEKKKPTRVLKK